MKLIKILKNLFFNFNESEFTIRFRTVQILFFAYYKLRIAGYKFNSYIHPSVSIQNFKNIHFSQNVHIHKGSIIWGSVTFSNNVSIGPNNIFYGRAIFGSNVMTSGGCVFAGGGHGFKKIDTPMLNQSYESKGGIVIQDDVWIGANSTILDGVTVHKGAIVGAGSLVTKNVNAFDIVGGVPAIKISSRIDIF